MSQKHIVKNLKFVLTKAFPAWTMPRQVEVDVIAVFQIQNSQMKCFWSMIIDDILHLFDIADDFAINSNKK